MLSNPYLNIMTLHVTWTLLVSLVMHINSCSLKLGNLPKIMDLSNINQLLPTLISIIVIIKIIKTLFTHRHRDDLSTLPLPPSPPSHPILGHLHLMNLSGGSPHISLQTLSAQYGPTLLFRLGTRRLLLLSSAASVEQCFSKNDIVFANRPEALAFQINGYNYTTIPSSSYGDHWRNLRRIGAIHMFSAARIRRTAAVRNTQVQEMIRNLTRSSDPTRKKIRVNLNTQFSKLAHHVAGLITAGKIYNHVGDIFRPVGLINICDFVPVLKWIGYKGIERNLKEVQRERDEFLQQMIDDFWRENGGVLPEKNNTVLELLMGLQGAEPEVYTDVIIKGMLAIMFTAGMDTSIRTMEWAMSLLLNHPEILAKARHELDTIIKPGHFINDSDVPNLPYLRCIINETLRLFPIAPLLVPHCSSDKCVVNGYIVPKDTILMVNAWAVHRDEAMWDAPNEFRPERFKGFEGERDGYRFIPFGVGRRSCPGAAIGMRFVGLSLGAMIQCFEWETVGSGKEDLSHGTGGITLPKGKPLEAMYSVRDSMSDLLSKLL